MELFTKLICLLRTPTRSWPTPTAAPAPAKLPGRAEADAALPHLPLRIPGLADVSKLGGQWRQAVCVARAREAGAQVCVGPARHRRARWQ